jgi:quinoprotein glucose dehydrogenase
MSSIRIRIVGCAVAVGAAVCASAVAQRGAPDGDWPHYAGDQGSTKYSGLSDINAANFNKLKVAWRWESADKELASLPYKPFHFRATPVVVDGVAYVSTGLSQIAAIDVATGETLWVHNPESYKRGPVTHSMYQHRGVDFWTDGVNERVFISTGGRQLVSLDAKTGEPDPHFADGGWVDLLKGLGRDVDGRSIGDNKPPVVVGDTVIVGSIIMDFPMQKLNPPGHIRGYDARSGAMKWRFNTIPQAGEFGVETWENGAWEYSGNTNAWSLMTADPELGYVYLPIGTPTSDYYGGHRHGANLFAESVLCLNASTGERVWHFQAVHHGIWDYDFPCAPILVDITVNGKKIKAVAQVSKQGFTYVFDRVTGEPVWPIEERPVNTATTVPGEKLYPTQPFPTKPPAFERQGMTEDDLIDFTPELRAAAKEIASNYVMGPIFSPNIVAGSDGKKGLLQLPSAGGGANWPGASVDPETGWLYVQSQTYPSNMSLMQPDQNRSDLKYMIAMGEMDGPVGPEGLPIVKPPYKRITAIDLNKGDIAWQIPFGDGPREHPAIKHLNLGPLGSMFPDGVIAEGGILVTKTLLITHIANVDELAQPRRAKGSLVQAYDKKTGKLIASIPVDRHLHSSPMTCSAGGKQFILIAGGGGGVEPSELLAFALPESP